MQLSKQEALAALEEWDEIDAAQLARDLHDHGPN